MFPLSQALDGRAGTYANWKGNFFKKVSEKAKYACLQMAQTSV